MGKVMWAYFHPRRDNASKHGNTWLKMVMATDAGDAKIGPHLRVATTAYAALQKPSKFSTAHRAIANLAW